MVKISTSTDTIADPAYAQPNFPKNKASHLRGLLKLPLRFPPNGGKINQMSVSYVKERVEFRLAQRSAVANAVSRTALII